MISNINQVNDESIDILLSTSVLRASHNITEDIQLILQKMKNEGTLVLIEKRDSWIEEICMTAVMN